MDKKNVCFATGSRADYGIVRNYLRKLDSDEHINLSIIVTGSLLSKEFGHQVDLIYNDGFNIEAKIEIDVDTSSNASVIHSMSDALNKFGYYFQNHKPDLLIILGDRYEMLSVAIAAAMNRLPILHIHGGEATYGNYDEFIRHSITKMSTFHFTATEEYRHRVIQLGEDPERVYNLGALGAENCLFIEQNSIPKCVTDLNGQLYFVVLFHPETLTNVDVENQVEEVLKAIERNNTFKYVFLGSNADTESHIIRERIKKFVREKSNCTYYENLPTAGYHSLLKNALGLIGNSSSGLIEAPSLGIYTINIGDRQEGRVRGNSVIDVPCKEDLICEAIERVAMRKDHLDIVNPYYKKNSAELYFNTTCNILKNMKVGDLGSPKHFYDISF